MHKVKNGDSSLRSVAAITFFTYAARGLTFPFISLYLVAVGFSGVQIGFVLSASAAMRLIIPPVLNTIADRLGKHRQLYYGLVTGNVFATFGLVLSAFSKWTLGATVVVRDSLDTPSASLLSQLTITKIRQQGRDNYGQLRAWGSFGWGVTTMMSGLLFGLGGYAMLFMTAALLNLASLHFSQALPRRTTDENPAEETKNRLPAKRQRGFYILMVSWFFFYVGMSAIGGFMYVYFKQDLGVSNAMVGVLASVAALAEIPSMIVIDRMMRRINTRTTLLIGMLGMAGLWLTFTLLNGATFLIPLMMVRGTFYTFQNIANTLLVSRISHPTNAATNQAISQVTIPALAVLVTGPIAGWIFDTLGARALFRLVAMVALIGAILLVMARQELAKTPMPEEMRV